MSNNRFVICIAKRFQKKGLSLHYLIFRGNLGLIKAVEKFHETLAFEFNTFTIWCIRQSIIQAFVYHSPSRPIPLNKIGLISKFNHLFDNTEEYYHREPTTKEITAMINYQNKIMEDVLLTNWEQLFMKNSGLKNHSIKDSKYWQVFNYNGVS